MYLLWNILLQNESLKDTSIFQLGINMDLYILFNDNFSFKSHIYNNKKLPVNHLTNSMMCFIAW